MSELPDATRAADQRLLPTDSGDHAGTANAVTTSASNIDLGAIMARGGAFVSLQARGGDVYVRGKSSATTPGTTSGNSSNGVKIADGATTGAVAEYWVSPGTRYLDVIGSASCTLFVWVSSPNYGNRPPR